MQTDRVERRKDYGKPLEVIPVFPWFLFVERKKGVTTTARAKYFSDLLGNGIYLYDEKDEVIAVWPNTADFWRKAREWVDGGRAAKAERISDELDIR